MTDDLIERLRELTMAEVSRDGYCREEPVPINRDGPEAAARIATQQEAIDELVAAARAVIDEAGRMTMTMRRRKIFNALDALLSKHGERT